MDKKTALEYIVSQGKRVTAKEVSIDLDAPISTTTELLERMSAQGLLERDRDQRPREYAVTEEGRKRLEFFRSRDGDRSAPGDAHAEAGPSRNPNLNTGASASGVAPLPSRVDGSALSQKLDSLRDEVCSRLDALREDFRDLLHVLPAKPSSAASAAAEDAPARIESVSSRAEALLKRMDALLARKRVHPKAREYYQACCDLANAPAFSFRNPARKRKVAELEDEIPSEIVVSVKRVRELESRESPLSPDEAKALARLRAELGFDSEPVPPASESRVEVKA